MRKAEIAELRAAYLAVSAKQLEAARTRKPLLRAFIAECLNKVKSKNAIVIGAGPAGAAPRARGAGSFIGPTLAGGLGWVWARRSRR